MTSAIAELEQALQAATVERSAAEERERQARVALESAKSEAASSIARRAELAEALGERRLRQRLVLPGWARSADG